MRGLSISGMHFPYRFQLTTTAQQASISDKHSLPFQPRMVYAECLCSPCVQYIPVIGERKVRGRSIRSHTEATITEDLGQCHSTY